MAAGIGVFRWFAPFFESVYGYAEEDLAVRIPALKKAPETIEKMRFTDRIPWLDRVIQYLDMLTGDYSW